MKTKFNLWPLGIVLVFVVFIGGMATAVVIASTHRDPLVTQNYYEDELKFQSQIDGLARAGKVGAAITYEAAPGRVTLSLPTVQLGQTFSGTLELYSSVDPKADREFRLEPRADGTQTLDVSKLAAGSWTVRAKWNAAGETYFLEQKIKI
ncbi:MAG: hypothetical protein RL616_2200 [Verrucomicrobiota bacterium]|jgi:hypothetical protein